MIVVALQRHPKSFAPQLLQFLAISPGPLFLPLDWSVFGSRTKRYQTLSTKELRNLSAPGECSESKQDSSNKVNRQPRRTQFANWKRMLGRGGMLMLYKRYMKQNPRLYHAVVRNVCYQIYLAISCNVHPKTHSLSCFHCIDPLYLLSLRLQRKRSRTMMDSICSL